MIKIAVTGNIGSGKTTVCKYFEELGVPVYYSDVEARRIMETDESVIKQVTDLFGPEAYVDGKLNRPFIGGKAFNNKELLNTLNSIVHPVLHRDTDEWFKAQKTAPYALYESAILYEIGMEDKFDEVILVVASLETRIRRVMKRDGITAEQVIAKVNNQLSDKKKIDKCNYLINTDTKNCSTKDFVETLHKWIILKEQQ